MNLSTVLKEGGTVELRCGQCWIDQQKIVLDYALSLLGTLHLAGGHSLVFTEHQRVAGSGGDQPRYPISYLGLSEDPTTMDLILIGAHRGQEMNLVLQASSA